MRVRARGFSKRNRKKKKKNKKKEEKFLTVKRNRFFTRSTHVRDFAGYFE